MSAQGSNGYAARLDGHDREIRQLRESQSRAWETINDERQRTTRIETTAGHIQDDVAEIRGSVEEIKASIRTAIMWGVGVSISLAALAATIARAAG